MEYIKSDNGLKAIKLFLQDNEDDLCVELIKAGFKLLLVGKRTFHITPLLVDDINFLENGKLQVIRISEEEEAKNKLKEVENIINKFRKVKMDEKTEPR